MQHPYNFSSVITCDHGNVIVNRFDTNQTNALFKTGRALDYSQISAMGMFLKNAPAYSTVLDVGANFGLFSLEFGRMLAPKKGVCHGFEAQRIIAYMAAGTMMLNGIENVHIHHKAVGRVPGKVEIPKFDYNKEASFGSIEFGHRQKEFIGQHPLDGSEVSEMVEVVTLDSQSFENVFLMKVDVEGMEQDVLAGARELILRDKPLLCLEWFKSDKAALISTIKSFGYEVYEWQQDLICAHPEKKGFYQVKIDLQRL
jgi:FkbM family methyltransferase